MKMHTRGVLIAAIGCVLALAAMVGPPLMASGYSQPHDMKTYQHETPAAQANAPSPAEMQLATSGPMPGHTKLGAGIFGLLLSYFAMVATGIGLAVLGFQLLQRQGVAAGVPDPVST